MYLFARHVGKPLIEVNSKAEVLDFLNSIIKPDDPEKRWISTWNHYINKIKMFYRFLHLVHIPQRDWDDETSGLPTPALFLLRAIPFFLP